MCCHTGSRSKHMFVTWQQTLKTDECLSLSQWNLPLLPRAPNCFILLIVHSTRIQTEARTSLYASCCGVISPDPPNKLFQQK